jgi:hypothetical protein
MILIYIHGWWLCFWKMIHVCPLVSKCLYMILTCFSDFAMPNLCLDDLFWSYGPLICHHECLARMLYLVDGHKFLFVARTFHVPIWIWKWNVNILENVLPCHMCLIYLLLGTKQLHDAYQWEVSYIEVGTRLSGFDMRCLRVFMMIL